MQSCPIPIVSELPVIEEKFGWTSEIFQDTCKLAELTMADGKTGKQVRILIHKDTKGNMWNFIYEKNEANKATLGLEVSRPEVLMTQKGGMTPAAMRMDILLTKASDLIPFHVVDEVVICVQTGGSHTLNFGYVSEVLKHLGGGRLTMEVSLEHFDNSFLMKEVNEGAEEKMTKVKKFDVFNTFGDYLEDGDSSDFQMEVEGKVFHLHKAILSVRSPAFLKLFMESHSDSSIAQMMTDGLSKRTVEFLLHFIYTGKLALSHQDTLQTLEDLLFSIEKWEVSRLRKLVERRLVNCATVETAERLFELASIHRLDLAVAMISVFIVKNRKAIFALRRTGRRVGAKSN